jgi:hypothetical protein
MKGDPVSASEVMTFATDPTRRSQILQFADKARIEPDWIIERALDFGLPQFFEYYRRLFSANAEKTSQAKTTGDGQAAIGPTLELPPLKRGRGRPRKIK